MELKFVRQFAPLSLMLLFAGCGTQPVDVVDLNKVIDALVAVLDEGKKPADPGLAQGGEANIAAAAGSAEVTSTAEIEAIEPSKQNPTLEAEFLTKFASKLNELKAMNGPVGVSMSAGGEIVGFKDSDGDNVQDMGETKEFTVAIDPANNRLVASDNNGYHRPHGYGFSPGGMMMGYMLGSMMGRQGSFYSGAMSSARPNFTNTSMSPANYHQSAVNSVRSRSSASSFNSGARSRTGSKGFSFGK